MEAHREEITLHKVALLAEGVDRNMAVDYVTGLVVAVALLAEGVDRNIVNGQEVDAIYIVALLAEGVDRNTSCSSWQRFSAGRPPHGGRG